MSDDTLLDIHDIHKAYGGVPALRGVSLSIAAGAVVCLLGPSGCGKTSLLRVVAGLEQADSGSISFAGKPIGSVPPHLRGFGLMFQDYALFPHRNVAENIAFGLRMQNLPRPQIDARVAEMLALVGLEGYERRQVYELSGGERQRVALARSLAPSPGLLMLDEPLGALDRALRERLLDQLRTILKRVGVTSIYVTHDQAEAFAIADWLVLMNAGRIEQQGPPEQVYRQPASQFAARFLGLDNLSAGQVLRGRANRRGARRDADRSAARRRLAHSCAARPADDSGPTARGGRASATIRPRRDEYDPWDRGRALVSRQPHAPDAAPRQRPGAGVRA